MMFLSLKKIMTRKARQTKRVLIPRVASPAARCDKKKAVALAA